MKRVTIREDGYVLHGYYTTKNGERRPHWLSPEAWEKKCAYRKKWEATAGRERRKQVSYKERMNRYNKEYNYRVRREAPEKALLVSAKARAGGTGKPVGGVIHPVAWVGHRETAAVPQAAVGSHAETAELSGLARLCLRRRPVRRGRRLVRPAAGGDMKVGVVGLKSSQAQMVAREFGDLSISHLESDCTAPQLSAMARRCQHVVLMTRFISHKHQTTLNAAGARLIRVSGGMAQLRSALRQLGE